MSTVAQPPTSAPTEERPDGQRRLRRNRRGGRSTLIRDIIEVLLLALFLYFIITFALQTVRVDGSSMEPTLHGSEQNGHDLLFADKLSYHIHAPGRGDIIILQPPDDTTTDFIKRVIGVPGDVVEVAPKGYVVDGKTAQRAEVLVKPNGQGSWQVLDEPYLPDQSRDPWTLDASCCRGDAAHLGEASDTPQPFTVPQDRYFVLGDNRNASKDSRIIGLIPRGNIVGRAWVRIWPLGRLGFLGSGPSLQMLAVLPLPLGRLGWRRRRRRRCRVATR